MVWWRKRDSLLFLPVFSDLNHISNMVSFYDKLNTTTSSKDIAKQFFEFSKNMTVALAGGKRHFYPNEHRDGRLKENFIEKWQKDENVKYIETNTELKKYVEGSIKVLIYL